MAQAQSNASLFPDSLSFLGVRSSATGKHWIRRGFDARMAEAIAATHDLPIALAEAMSARGIALHQAAHYLEPTLRHSLPDPSHLRDMDKAARRIADAITRRDCIAVFGDYDVDGATSAAQLLRFFRHQGIESKLYIPDRITEGYGPNVAAIEKLAAQGCHLVVAVDCGTTSHVPLMRARELGLDVVVIDHHTAEPSLPPAVALVNPNRVDETSSCGHLAACGLTFLLLIAVNRVLRSEGWYGPQRAEPDLRQWLDLVALGTVADVVRLEGLNRTFVTHGLKIMARRNGAGLAALADIAALKQAPDAYALGYMLGPRVNAGGRVGAADMGARLLAMEDPVEAAQLARQLDVWNTERRQIEADVLADAMQRLDPAQAGPIVIAAGDGWHPGVIGIAAARLKEKFHKPVFVIAFDGDIGKGSGRSIPGIDLGSLVIAARQSGLLIAGGGHAMAAGLTIERSALPDLEKFFNERIAAITSPEHFQPKLKLDGMLSITAADSAFCTAQRRLEPFGNGNAEPRFAFASCRVAFADIVGENHIKLALTDGAGARLSAIAFKAHGTALGEMLITARRTGTPCHVAGQLRLDSWQGRDSVQLIIADAAMPAIG